MYNRIDDVVCRLYTDFENVDFLGDILLLGPK